MASAYDEVPYDTEANVETHPVAMATLARLAGLTPAPAWHARVLEIGCGDGENLGAAAAYLPEARFVGFDLAERAISSGRRPRSRTWSSAWATRRSRGSAPSTT
ncbi:MAG: class I SAM-dependent methyltransferase [Labilithrix sp.]